MCILDPFYYHHQNIFISEDSESIVVIKIICPNVINRLLYFSILIESVQNVNKIYIDVKNNQTYYGRICFVRLLN